MESIIWIVVIALAAGVAWAFGASRNRRRYGAALADLARAVERGDEDLPTRGPELPGVPEVRSALRANPPDSRGGRSPRDGKTAAATGIAPGAAAEPESLILSALGRIRSYLEEGVEEPLREGLEDGGGAVEGGVADALVALEDLYFYLRPVPGGRSAEDLNELARDAGSEYRREWDIPIDVHVPERPTAVEVNREALLDALYLALHNAGTFGGGEGVEVVVRYQEGDCWLVVRDRGPGFTEEALRRAFEPFYTTSDSTLGLGLHQVRKIVEAMGGTVAVRNRPGGGGQLEVVLPETE